MQVIAFSHHNQSFTEPREMVAVHMVRCGDSGLRFLMQRVPVNAAIEDMAVKPCILQIERGLMGNIDVDGRVSGQSCPNQIDRRTCLILQ